jgi:FlaA1/EpsC-like NDP-sugar epimerase
MMILIKELSDEEFQVIVNAKNPTSHNVTLTYDTHQNLTNGKVSKKELIEFSFKFLLERECYDDNDTKTKHKIIKSTVPYDIPF